MADDGDKPAAKTKKGIWGERFAIIISILSLVITFILFVIVCVLFAETDSGNTTITSKQVTSASTGEANTQKLDRSIQKVKTEQTLVSGKTTQHLTDFSSVKTDMTSFGESLNTAIDAGDASIGAKEDSNSNLNQLHAQKLETSLQEIQKVQNVSMNQTTQQDTEVSALDTKLVTLGNSFNKSESKRLWEHLIIEDWSIAGDYLYQHYTHDVSFGEARNECKKWGARLASVIIRNATLRNIVYEHVIGPASDHTWIGVENIDGIAPWVWSDGVSADTSNTDWEDVPPGTAVQCGYLSHDGGPSIFISPCTEEFHYLCEIKP